MAPKQLAVLTLTAVSLAWQAHASAQDAGNYPSKTIKVVCAFPPGNSSDIAARLLGEQLQKRFGQPVIVENRPGASGIIAATAVQKAPADGYTLLMTSTSFVVNKAIIKDLSYDVQRDFAAVNLINSIPAVLLVNKAFPANNLKEFIAEVSRQPGKYSYGHVGVGTIQNMSMKLFQQRSNTSFNEVPYKGSAQAISDIAGGSLDMMFEAANSAYTLVEAGRVRAIVSTGPKRYSLLPNVPTLIESGLDVTVVGFTVLMAPAGTPAPILSRLNSALQTILNSSDTQAAMRKMGLEVYPQLDNVAVDKWLASEGEKWEKVAAAAKIPKQ
jgi:tripartite-type tricarboxylate transporter receptor subunit TctC